MSGNVVPFDVQFAKLVFRIRQLILSDPAHAFRLARSLLRQAAARPFGNDPIANLQRFTMIDEARQLMTESKLALVAAGGMIPDDRNQDQDATVIPLNRPKS